MLESNNTFFFVSELHDKLFNLPINSNFQLNQMQKSFEQITESEFHFDPIAQMENMKKSFETVLYTHDPERKKGDNTIVCLTGLEKLNLELIDA
jgi:hypothetical protein